MLLDQFFVCGGFETFAHHFGNQFAEGDLRRPAEFGLGLGRVTEQGFDLGRTEVARVDGDNDLAGGVVALLFDTLALPTDFHAEFLGGGVDEVPD